ncbi:MAG: hypothetical protein ACBZ72_01615 [Candidatus Bathyarchaeia archaeon]
MGKKTWAIVGSLLLKRFCKEKSRLVIVLSVVLLVLLPVGLVRADSGIEVAPVSPSIVWQRTFYQGTSTSASSVTQTSDGGYVLAGTVILNSLGEIEYWVTKTDSLGNQQWSINGLQQPGFGPASSIVQTPDGGCAFVCSYGGFYGPSYLIKTNSQGEIQYNQSYSSFSFSSLQISGDGDFVMAGYQNKSFALAKANSTGNIEWSHTYGDSEDNTVGFVSLVTTNDGGYALGGWIWLRSNGGGANNAITKTDANGSELWTRYFAGDGARQMIKTSNGDFAIATSSGIVKVDGNGSEQWTISNLPARTACLVQTQNDGYAIAGEMPSGGSKPWLAIVEAANSNPTTQPSGLQSSPPTMTTASPSPSIPELTPWVPLALAVVVCVVVVVLRRRLKLVG